jgi:hypothetical protein
MILKDFIDKAPSSMLAYAISIGGQEKKLHKIMDLFDSTIDSLLEKT